MFKDVSRHWHDEGSSLKKVLALACLLGVDSFGGGLVMHSLIAYWFHERYGISQSALGIMFGR